MRPNARAGAARLAPYGWQSPRMAGPAGQTRPVGNTQRPDTMSTCWTWLLVSAHVFVDETERNVYLICAVLVDPADLDSSRRALRALRKPGQTRLHMVKEQPSRRREILAAVGRLELRTRLYQCPAPPVVARPRCLQALVVDLVKAGAARLVLERLETQEHADRRCIRATLVDCDAQLTYRHEPAQVEPLLWAADAIAWAYGAGSDWRRRISRLVDDVIRLEP
jgi:hypothetical protein